MKKFKMIVLALSAIFLLSGCGEWDDLVDSVSGSDDDETAAVTPAAPRKDVSTPSTTPATKTETKTETSKDTSSQGGFDDKATYSYYNVGNGGRMAWRINKKGTAFGKTIKLVFSNGYTVIIPNTSQRFAKSDGLIYRPGIGSIESGTGTSHGGIYLYAPYGNKSKSVTIWY